MTGPGTVNLPSRHGRIAWIENACLAHAWNAGQQVRYWREEPLEVDAVVTGSWGAWAIEVKTGRFGPAELTGLFELVRRNPELRPLVVCGDGGRAVAERAGARAIRWQDFLLDGPPRT